MKRCGDCKHSKTTSQVDSVCEAAVGLPSPLIDAPIQMPLSCWLMRYGGPCGRDAVLFDNRVVAEAIR